MLTRKYQVCMHTTIGQRYGTMDVQIEGHAIRGLLNLLQHSEAFFGKIDEVGNCIFSGRMITPMQIIPYTAKGKLTENSLALSLTSGKNAFEMTGSACLGEEPNL